MSDKAIIGRLASRRYREGDELPATGSTVLISGVHNDVESYQHRGYMWRYVVGYSKCGKFICLQSEGCWPTVERLENCWIAQIRVRKCEVERHEVTP